MPRIQPLTSTHVMLAVLCSVAQQVACQRTLGISQLPKVISCLAFFLALALVGFGESQAATRQNKPISHKVAQRPHPSKVKTKPFEKTPAFTRLAQDIAQSQALPLDWVAAQLSKAKHLTGIPRLVLPPETTAPKNWAAYRERFIEPRRIQTGIDFWRAHQDALQRAETTYGVPASLVVGIMGVETFFGKHMGGYDVLDALTTLSLDFPSAHPRAIERQAFFQKELGHFLKAVHQRALGLHTKGSYAGAIGWPQFMPSSMAQFAVDFDGDGRIDLISNPVDAIGSVAHYLQAFGWKTGMPTHYRVTPPADPTNLETLLAPDIVPSFQATTMTDLGAQLDAAGQAHPGALALVMLQNGFHAPSYVAGTDNFYVVTRYNWSSYYALAVIELGQAIKAAM